MVMSIVISAGIGILLQTGLLYSFERKLTIEVGGLSLLELHSHLERRFMCNAMLWGNRMAWLARFAIPNELQGLST